MEDQLKRAVAQQPRADQVENAFELPETPNSDQFQTEIYRNQQIDVDNSLDKAAVPAEISLQPVDFGQPLQKST
jgi:hypothetical protein